MPGAINKLSISKIDERKNDSTSFSNFEQSKHSCKSYLYIPLEQIIQVKANVIKAHFWRGHKASLKKYDSLAFTIVVTREREESRERSRAAQILAKSIA